MTPKQWRAGGRGEVIHFALAESSLGSVLVASSATGVVAILLGDDPETLLQSLQQRFRQAELIGADQGYEQLVAQVVGLVEDPSRGATLPLDIRGTAFQQRVWQALQQIPRGQTASYADVAARIGAPRSSRAVARACASNPLAVAVPCHRVVRRDGDLSGYAWGVARKRELLRRKRPRLPEVGADLGRHTAKPSIQLHHQLAEVASLQQPEERLRRILQPFHHILAVLDAAFAQPLPHLTFEVRPQMVEVVHDEATHGQALAQDLAEQCRQPVRPGCSTPRSL